MSGPHPSIQRSSNRVINGLAAALLCCGRIAHAEFGPSWVLVEESSSDDALVLYDPATRTRDGDLVEMWEMHLDEKPGKLGEVETRIRTTHDCKNRTSRGTYMIRSDKAGTVVDEGPIPPSAFATLAPHTKGESLWIRACTPPENEASPGPVPADRT
jgi:hypothetical protein